MKGGIMKDKVEQFLTDEKVLLASRLILGSIFIAASIGKLQHLNVFVNLVASYNILPYSLAEVYGFLVPWLELLIGSLLILGLFTRFASALSIPIIISFIIASSHKLLIGAEGGCGCFGEVMPLTTSQALYMDAVMLLLTIMIIRRSTVAWGLDHWFAGGDSHSRKTRGFGFSGAGRLFIVGIIAFVLILGGCQRVEPEAEEEGIPPPLTVGAPVYAEFYGVSGMYFGVGLDTVSMNICGKCVELPEGEPQRMGGGGYTFHLKMIKEQSELRSQLGVTANTSLNIGLYSASGQGKYVKEQVEHSFSVYASVSVDVEGPEYSYEQGVKLKEEYEEMYEEDYFKFRKHCGDRYLESIKTGGKYHAIIEIRTTSREAQQKVQTNISGGGGTWKAGTDFSNSIGSLSQKYSLNIWELQVSGDLTQKIPVSVEEMIDHATNFPGTVVAGDYRTAPARATFKDYEAITTAEAGEVANHLKAMDTLTRYYDKYYDLLYDVQFIDAHEDTGWYTKAEGWEIKLDGETYTLRDLSSYIKEDIFESILDAAQDCARDSGKCASYVPKGLIETYNAIRDKLPNLDNYFPKNCSDIKLIYSALGDDYYKIFYQGNNDQSFCVWCQDLRTDSPKEYIKVKPETNYSGMSAGHYYKGNNVRSAYSKIRIYPDTLKVDIYDHTFAISSGEINFIDAYGVDTWTRNYAPYGYPSNCCSCDKRDNPESVARIDLTGTSFALRDDVLWQIKPETGHGGYGPPISPNRQIVELRAANGHCGWAKPTPGLFLKYIQKTDCKQ